MLWLHSWLQAGGRLLISSFLLASASFSLHASTPIEEIRLVDFELKDQFGDIHLRRDVEGTIVLLIGSDKDGSEYNGLWSKAIHDALGAHPDYSQISHLAYADVRGVPFFLKGVIRGYFPEEPENWNLMGWKGELAEIYDFVPESTNILLFAPNGDLVHLASGHELDEDVLDSLITALREQLDNLATP